MRRWLPIEPPIKGTPLGRMLRVCLAHGVLNVQKWAQLQKLRRVYGSQLFPRLETHGSLVVLLQPGL